MWNFFTKTIIAFTLSVFVWKAWSAWQETPSVTLALLVIGEVLTVAIYLTARKARDVSFRPAALLSTFAATFFFLLVVLIDGKPLIPLWLSSAIQASGITLSLISKASLGRSFGLLPANRGVVANGTYKWVRHPIYLGYLISHLGFLLGSFVVSNLILIAALTIFQIIRIREEERLLSSDSAYISYTRSVRWRLLPGAW